MYYILQSGRSPLHVIMSAMPSQRFGQYCILEAVERLIEAGADVNAVDKVSYRQTPYYNN